MRKTSDSYVDSWLMGIDPEATGKQLKSMRRMRGYTQEYLSELFEFNGESASKGIISQWENGKKMPTLAHVVFLSELYNCSLDELIVSYRRSKERGDEDQLVPFLQHKPGKFTGGLFSFRKLGYIIGA